MGLGEILGIKQIRFETKEPLSLEELYDKIKDTEFDAGFCKLVTFGFAPVIAFPEVDHNNQVQIQGKKGKFYVFRSTNPAGLDNFAKNIIRSELTDGWSDMSAVFGSKKKLCMELTQKTYDKIAMMDL